VHYIQTSQLTLHGEQTFEIHYLMFNWLSFKAKRLLQTIQSCMRY
jgi:hypothetical protein